MFPKASTQKKITRSDPSDIFKSLSSYFSGAHTIMRILFLPLLLASLFSNASAQVLKINRGDIDIGGLGQFDNGTTTLQLRLGIFSADYVQIGTQVQFQDSNFADRVAFNVFVIRLFETRTYLLPYVGAAVGHGTLNITGGAEKSGAEFYLLTGLKYFLADNVSLNTEVHFGFSSSETFLGDRKLESNEVGLRIGISYVF